MARIIAVPVTEPVKQFMLTAFGHDDVISFEKDSYIGRLMKCNLEKIDFKIKAKQKPEGTVYLNFELPYAFRTYDMSEATAINLGSFLESQYLMMASFLGLGMNVFTKNDAAKAQSFIEMFQLQDFCDNNTLRLLMERRMTSLLNHKSRQLNRKKFAKSLMQLPT